MEETYVTSYGSECTKLGLLGSLGVEIQVRRRKQDDYIFIYKLKYDVKIQEVGLHSGAHP
jgi:hypothetical protein